MILPLLIVCGLGGLAIATPAQLMTRQIVSNELDGPCRDITLVFARASTERGNMGGSMGPTVCKGLKSKFGAQKVACQGVGGAYKAGLETNMLPEGTSAAAYQEAMHLLAKTHTKCPQSKIVTGGYSQGTAVMMNAISKSPPEIRNKIRGVVFFGYTKNGQQKSGIPNFPKERVKVFCTQSDGVCWGKLSVTAGHFAYMGNGSGSEAIRFLMEALKGQAAAISVAPATPAIPAKPAPPAIPAKPATPAPPATPAEAVEAAKVLSMEGEEKALMPLSKPEKSVRRARGSGLRNGKEFLAP